MTDSYAFDVDEFIRRRALPASFRATISNHYARLADWLTERIHGGRGVFLLGVSGAQGSGKSTLAEYLEVALSPRSGTVTALSIDDFYLTRAERRRLAEQVHPLLETRGVPGTHDMALLEQHIAALAELEAGETLLVPRFEKSTDDRAPQSAWRKVSGPVSLIVLEGWCLGARPQTDDELVEPINALERDEDPDGRWRRFVNASLSGMYATLNAQFDALVYLQVPSFDSVYGWRLEQERKLARQSPGERVMSEEELARFILHYERLTRANLNALPKTADVVLRLGDDHSCRDVNFRA